LNDLEHGRIEERRRSVTVDDEPANGGVSFEEYNV
jgi:hypothetical protein